MSEIKTAEQPTLTTEQILNKYYYYKNSTEPFHPSFEAIQHWMEEYHAQFKNEAEEIKPPQPVEGVEEKTGDLVLADKSMLIKKVMFYREQTDKLRKYLFDNNIGLPNQGLWDAILEHLQSLNNKSVNNEGVTIEGQLKLRREKYPIGNNESVEEAAERVYDLIAQLSFGGFLSGRITVKEATLKINNLLEWYASQLKRIEEK